MYLAPSRSLSAGHKTFLDETKCFRHAPSFVSVEMSVTTQYADKWRQSNWLRVPSWLKAEFFVIIHSRVSRAVVPVHARYLQRQRQCRSSAFRVIFSWCLWERAWSANDRTYILWLSKYFCTAYVLLPWKMLSQVRVQKELMLWEGAGFYQCRSCCYWSDDFGSNTKWRRFRNFRIVK